MGLYSDEDIKKAAHCASILAELRHVSELYKKSIVTASLPANEVTETTLEIIASYQKTVRACDAAIMEIESQFCEMMQLAANDPEDTKGAVR